MFAGPRTAAPGTGRRRPWAAGLALCASLACAKAAGVLLDLPPASPPPERAPGPTAPPPGPGLAGTGGVEPDTARPAIERTLQPDSVLRQLPRHASGEIDWTAALRQGTIRPREAAPRTAAPAYGRAFGYDFYLPGPDRELDAWFPHSGHLEWLTCQNCHGNLLRYRGQPITMEAIAQGQACGACHGTVAFSRDACGRCHPAMPPGELTAALEDDLVLARAPDSSGATAAYPPSRFPHWVHRIRYRCAACHDALFPMRSGADTLTMAQLSAGDACGRCHDGASAFGLLECVRCHQPPRRSGGSR